MNYDLLFSNRKSPIEIGIIGVSGFNHSLFFYGSKSERTSVRVVCGRNIDKIQKAYQSIGVSPDMIQHCTSYQEGVEAFKKGKYLIFSDVSIAMSMPIDIVVEGTGNPEASAVHVLQAIENKKHVINVTKESDSVVGSILARKAKEHGVVYSLAEGDQPSLLVGLVTWAKAAGLSILSIGKSSEYDFIYDEKESTISVLDGKVRIADLQNYLTLNDDMASTLHARSNFCAEFSQRNIPDFAEMGIVCNHLPDFHPDKAEMHTPIARALEIPDIMCPKEYGGIFDGVNRIDVVNCLRRPDEQSLEGGEWVVVACNDEETWQVLKEKGVPVSRNQKTAMIYYPAHYLGFETLFSVHSVCDLGIPTGSAEPTPRYDLVARADRPLKKGTRLVAQGHHHVIEGLEGLLMPAQPVEEGTQLPYFLADHTILKEDIAPGTLITRDMVEYSEDAVLWKLRFEQDKEFLLA